MGKRKKEDFSNQFKESIDPRFRGIFNSVTKCENENASTGQVQSNIFKHRHQNDSSGFQSFIGTKLSEYLDKHIKEVDRPVLENDFFQNRLESICLFSDSDIITEMQPVESTVQRKPKKKKHKKERSEKESLKDVVVTFDWIQKQAEILNS